MKRVAFLVLLSLLFGILQPAFAGMIRSHEPENYGGLARVFRAVLGGIAGFFAGGIPGAVIGAGFMAFVSPGSPGCSNRLDPSDPVFDPKSYTK